MNKTAGQGMRRVGAELLKTYSFHQCVPSFVCLLSDVLLPAIFLLVIQFSLKNSSLKKKKEDDEGLGFRVT